MGQLVLEAAETFHDQYGCSTRTLLCVVLVISRIHHRLLHLVRCCTYSCTITNSIAVSMCLNSLQGLTHQEAWMSLTRLRDTTISDIYSLAASLENVSTLTSRGMLVTSICCFFKLLHVSPALACSCDMLVYNAHMHASTTTLYSLNLVLHSFKMSINLPIKNVNLELILF